MKKDLFSGELFIPKRRNQKFTSIKNRVAYNNEKALKERQAKAFIDKPLLSNHRILIRLLQPNEKKTFSKEFLAGCGFNFSVMSHYDTYYEKVCPALYNFLLIDFNENKASITIYRKP